MGKQSYYNKDAKRREYGDPKSHQRNEMEDRLLSDKPIIENVAKYIKRVDVFLLKPTEKTDMKAYQRDIDLICKLFKWERLIHIYDNIKDFNYQTENYTKIFDFVKDIPYSPYNKPFKESKSGIKDVVKYYFGIKYFPCSYTMSRDKSIKQKIVAELKEYGLERLVKYGILDAIENCTIYSFEAPHILANQLHNISREPSREGQKVAHMVASCVRKSKQPTIHAWAQSIFNSFNPNKMISYDWSKEVPCVALVYKGKDVNYTRPLTVSFDPQHDSFWTLLRCKDISDREWFMYTVENYMQKEDYDEENDCWVRVHKHSSKNDEHFKKYLQHLVKNEPSVDYMINFLQKLGISLDDEDFFGDEEIIRMDCKYDQLPYNTPQDIIVKYFGVKEK